ncbi:glycosyltransferase family 2 protein [Mucilaginibacter antarcticus]|uniref:glycosyltransferase family 2 protein n=1 Tax=Mucilaginibacter antarcticus TaxID=1855725 RepID=UPI0036272750
MTMFKISFCTTCMNRLSHLKQTLKRNILDNEDYPNLEFILLDYNSTDGLKEYVRSELHTFITSKKLVYYRTEEPKNITCRTLEI